MTAGELTSFLAKRFRRLAFFDETFDEFEQVEVFGDSLEDRLCVASNLLGSA